MKVYYSDHYSVPLPEGHRFPMPKYALLRERILAEGLVAPGDLQPAEPAADEQILRVHDRDYFERVVEGQLEESEIRRIGLPWSPELVERSRRSVGGTLAACRAALQDGIAANLGGGTHHAHPGHGEGFCVFNDVAIAARAMQAEKRAGRLVILDCDVHQGDGSAAIFSGDPSVFTFSIHGEKNFPFRKQPSDLDLALPDASGDQAYLEALQGGAALAMQQARPGLAIYIAGADPYHDDRLGRLALTKDGLAARDRLVFEMCRAAGLPVAVVMGGGYARRVEDTVEIHLQTIRIACEYATA
ncbi:MAG: histone deacetylase [Anaerolineales bacterium]|nr:histone deacetylase [Anaerolineales bacterium]